MPTPGDRHTNRPLTNVSVAYLQQASNFIASRVFPTVPVQKQSDQYYTYPKGAWHRGEAQKRAPRTESAGGDFTLSTASYFANVYAFHRDISDQERGNADSVFNLDREATEFATHQLLVKRDKEWADTFFSSSVWDIDLSGSSTDYTQWDDYSSSDPIGDVQTQAYEIASTTGYMPNTLVLAPQVFRTLRNHPDVLDRIKYTQQGIVTRDLLASVFEVDNVYVPMSIRNAEVEGATDSIDFMFTDAALLCYSAPSPSIMRPSAGYTFKWAGLPGGSAGIRTNRFRMDHLAADRIEVEDTWDMKVVATDLGAFFGDALS